MTAQAIKTWFGERFKQEGTLIITIIICLLLGAFLFFRSSQKQNNDFKVTGDNTHISVNQQARLYQGVYVRGGTTIENSRASVGVFKELTPRFEVSVGGGVQTDKELKNQAFAELEGRVKF